jgi:hypothetical protein
MLLRSGKRKGAPDARCMSPAAPERTPVKRSTQRHAGLPSQQGAVVAGSSSSGRSGSKAMGANAQAWLQAQGRATRKRLPSPRTLTRTS